jgi:hypothetical protein
MLDNFSTDFSAEQSNLSKFRALNYIIKSGRLEERVRDSSIQSASVELDQRSYYGSAVRRASILVHALEEDDGVAYFSSIKKNY